MKAVVERIVPVGGAVTVAVDDTLFHRYGRKVHGARYQHDGSAKGRDGIGRGNCFVIVGIVVAVPFLARQVCLPVLFRLHIPKASASKTEQARAMVDLLAQALPRRTVHVVGDGLPEPDLARPARPRHLHHSPGCQRGLCTGPNHCAPAGADTPHGRADAWAPPPRWPPPPPGGAPP